MIKSEIGNKIEVEFDATHRYKSSSGGRGVLLNKIDNYKRYSYFNQLVFELICDGYVETERIVSKKEVKRTDYYGKERIYHKVYIKIFFEKKMNSSVDYLVEGI